MRQGLTKGHVFWFVKWLLETFFFSPQVYAKCLDVVIPQYAKCLDVVIPQYRQTKQESGWLLRGIGVTTTASFASSIAKEGALG